MDVSSDILGKYKDWSKLQKKKQAALKSMSHNH